MNKINVLILDPINGLPQLKVIEDSLQEYYRILNCNFIDIVKRYIGGKPFIFVIDDIGALKKELYPSLIDSKGNPMLVGPIIIANAEGEDLSSLTERDLFYLNDYIKRAVVFKNGNQTEITLLTEGGYNASIL